MNAAVRRLSHWVRVTLGLLVGIVVLLLLLAGGLWWWSGTEGSLDWTLRKATRSLPLKLEGVTGSLRDGLRVQRLVWEQDGLTVEARQVHLEWKAEALVTRTVHVEEFNAAQVIVTDKRPDTGEPLKQPATLALPIKVSVEKFTAGDVQYRKDSLEVQVSDAAGRYAFDGRGHLLDLQRLRHASGTYGATVKAQATGDMNIDAQLRGSATAPVPGSKEAVPVEFTARAAGPMRSLEVRASLDSRATSGGGAGPHADVAARVEPFATQPLPQARAVLERLDVGAFWPQAPVTSLSGRVEVQPAGEAWRLSADLTNAQPGPWDKRRLPARAVRGAGEWRDGTVFIRELVATIADGEVKANGQWRSGGWKVDATIAGLDPSAAYSTLAPMLVSGEARASQASGGIDFDVNLAGQPPARSARRPATAQADASALALQVQELVARGSWGEGTLTLESLRARASDALLQGKLVARPDSKTGRGRIELTAPGLRGLLDGEVAATRGGGRLEVNADDLARAQQWARKVPGVPKAIVEAAVSGQARANLTWRGGWEDPAVQGEITAPRLQWGAGAEAWQVRQASATVNGRLRDARLQVRAEAQQGPRILQAAIDARGGKAGEAWRATFSQLQVALRDPSIGAGDRPWALQTHRPFDAQWSRGVLVVSAGEATLTSPAPAGGAASAPAQLSWSPVRWGGGELQTAGRLSRLPMSWVALAGGPQTSAVTGDLVFDANWNATLGRNLRIDASLQRVAGDIDVLAEAMDGTSRRVRAGVREAFVRVQTEGDRVVMTARWDSERAGTAQAQVATRMSQVGGNWQWAEQAPLDGRVRASLPRIGIWSLLAPPGWRLRGSVEADLAVAGTRAQPRLNGVVRGNELALRSVVDGIELRDGRLLVRIDGDRLRVEEFLLRGAGEGEGGGTVTARGEGRWTSAGPELTANVQLAKLRASIRTDRRITMSGSVDARVAPQGSDVTGRLVVDEATIVIPEDTAPKLGEDVIVRNAPGQIATTAEERKRKPPPEGEQQRAKAPVRVALQLSLGDAFRVQGRGIDTRLAGTLEVGADSMREPRLTGVIRTVGGEYRAYNQRLTIERGVIRFTGAPDNPAIDVLAIRPRMEQRVGVMITGRAQSPLIRLYSEPEMSDAQKLTMLVTGRSTPGSGGEAALVQQAAMALLSARSGGTGGGLAGKVGLDALSVRRGEGGPLLSLGKQFADNFYASYERSLSGGMGTLYIFYEISRRLKVRAETGDTSAVDVIFTFSW